MAFVASDVASDVSYEVVSRDELYDIDLRAKIFVILPFNLKINIQYFFVQSRNI